MGLNIANMLLLTCGGVFVNIDGINTPPSRKLGGVFGYLGFYGMIMISMNRLYIDGENFLFKVADILKANKLIKEKSDITKLKISYLKELLSRQKKIDGVSFYAAKLHKYTESKALEKKSVVLIESQRRLKRYLTNDGVDFITSGHVRLQSFVPAGKTRREKVSFKEKGVDVRLAIDVMANVCDKKVKAVFLASSDSDMIPVVREVQGRGAKVFYVGFATQPNKGLIATCDQSILFRDDEIVESYRMANKRAKRRDK